MPDHNNTPRNIMILFAAILALTVSMSTSGCNGPVVNGLAGQERSAVASTADTTTSDVSDEPDSSPILAYSSNKSDKGRKAQKTGEAESEAKSIPSIEPEKQSSTLESAGETGGSPRHLYSGDSDELELYYGQVDNEDSASAVDDAIWRQFDLAQEYYSMGVVANRDASWEEAQYHFEKSIKILASLDIESDSVLTPEAVKYATLLSNVISDYRVTLRSLGQLEGDATPSVMIERFGDLEQRLGADSLVVFKQETQEITYDLPVKMNDRVKSSIIYFQTVAKSAFRKYLVRSQRYRSMFVNTLNKHGLPEDLIYLSLVESGYNPQAYSWARASGLWQFISSTGRLYGLKRNWWIDERRDPVKSTEAASRFLKDLYEQFGDWELAMAAYNGGPGRVRRTIKKQGTIDFWKMKLKRQTMDYVPLIYAAAIIAKDPERYGFTDIEFEDEIVWDEVVVDRCVDLKVVAKELGCKLSTLKDLNPELLRNYTPPNYKKYTLKVPRGKKAEFLAAYDDMPSPKETSWVQHKISRGETVSTIAAKYGVSQYAVLEANNLSRRSRIYAGKKLIVPVPLDRSGTGSSRTKKASYSAEGTVYTVRAGDNLWDIANGFGTSVDGLRRINYIERGSRIYVGQKLKIPSSAKNLKKNSKPAAGKVYASKDSGGKNNSGSSGKSGVSASTDARKYKVRSGDTLWEIARQHGTSTSKLRSLNGMGRSSRIYPGQMLTVSGTGGKDYIIHKVRRGESLSRIAKKYRTSISKILASNHLTDPDMIGVGHNLKIYVK